VNLYGFVGNNPILWIDFLGQRDYTSEVSDLESLTTAGKHDDADKIKAQIAEELRAQNTRGEDSKPTTVTVGECTIVILVGHGSDDPGRAHAFNLGKHSRAGFIGCYPGNTNSKIPASERLEGVPMDHAERAKSVGPTEGETFGRQRYGPEIIAAYVAAKKVAKEELCCDCKQVAIIITATNPTTNGLAGEPSPFGEDVISLYDCATDKEYVLKGDTTYILTGKPWDGKR
jgi:hypothetical protein